MKAPTRNLFLVGLAVSALVASATAIGEEEKKQAKLGKQAPNFTLTDSNGQDRTLADYKGKIVVLEWINPRCPYVQNCYNWKSMQGARQKVKELSKGLPMG